MNAYPYRHTGRRGLLIGFAFGALLMMVIGGVAWWSLGSTRVLGNRPSQELSATERRGETIYNASCASCHGVPSGGTMMDYPPRHDANGHTWHHPDCELIQIVREGGDAMTEAMREMMAPPDAPRMQAFKDRLSPEKIAAVLAFIKTMWTPEERAAQADITRQACATARSTLCLFDAYRPEHPPRTELPDREYNYRRNGLRRIVFR